jgi:hypothetical protein
MQALSIVRSFKVAKYVVLSPLFFFYLTAGRAGIQYSWWYGVHYGDGKRLNPTWHTHLLTEFDTLLLKQKTSDN